MFSLSPLWRCLRLYVANVTNGKLFTANALGDGDGGG